MFSVTPEHFSQSGKNSLLLKQLAGFPKTPRRDRTVYSCLAESMIKAIF
jgi:hypothetical protein